MLKIATLSILPDSHKIAPDIETTAKKITIANHTVNNAYYNQKLYTNCCRLVGGLVKYFLFPLS